MKNTRNKFLALILIATVAFFSCKKEDPIPVQMPAANITTSSTENPTFTKGDWRVALLQEHSVDNTNNLRGYLFRFNSNGTVIALKDSSSVNGKWSSQLGDEQRKFMINFSSEPLNDLNQDWRIKGETWTSLKLEHTNADDGSTDYLTFQRNQQE